MRIGSAAVLVSALLVAGCVARPLESLPSSVRTSLSPSPLSSPSRGPAASLAVDDAPSIAPSDEPVPSAAGPEIVVAIRSGFGTLAVRVESNGLVTSGRAATDAEMARIDLGERDIGLLAIDQQRLLIVWIGTICERSARLVVVPPDVVLAPDPRPGCDASAFGWGLVLTTADPLNAPQLRARQAPTILLPQ